MPDSPPDEHLWPRWLRRGCLGCGALVALALLVGVVVFIVAILWQTTDLGPLPTVTLQNDTVAVPRLKDIYIESAHFLPNGDIVAVAGPRVSRAHILAMAFTHFEECEDPEQDFDGLVSPKQVMLHTSAGWVTETFPVRKGSVVDFRVCPVSPGAPLMVMTSYPVEGAWDDYRDELWQLDPASHRWTPLMVFPDGTNAGVLGVLGRLPGSGAVLVDMRYERPVGHDELWTVEMSGKTRQVARVEFFRDSPTRFAPDGSSLSFLISRTSEDSITVYRIDTYDLATGRKTSRPVTILPEIQPGPPSPEEDVTLVPRPDQQQASVAAINWRTARLRLITRPSAIEDAPLVISDRRWAIGLVQSSSKADLVAIDLTSGQPHLLLRETGYVPQVVIEGAAPDHRSFLLDTHASGDRGRTSPDGFSYSDLLQIYPDFVALARAPVYQQDPDDSR